MDIHIDMSHRAVAFQVQTGYEVVIGLFPSYGLRYTVMIGFGVGHDRTCIA